MPLLDVFLVHVEYGRDHYRDQGPVYESTVEIAAQTVNEATLVASQMVMSRGMKVHSARVDWDNF